MTEVSIENDTDDLKQLGELAPDIVMTPALREDPDVESEDSE